MISWSRPSNRWKPSTFRFTSSHGSVMLRMAAWLRFAEMTVTAATGELRIHTCVGISRTRIVHGNEIRGFEIKPGRAPGLTILQTGF
jgi:hypothetical protein